MFSDSLAVTPDYLVYPPCQRSLIEGDVTDNALKPSVTEAADGDPGKLRGRPWIRLLRIEQN